MMVEWMLSHGEFIATSAFWLCLVLCLLALGVGLYKHSWQATILGSVLLLPTLFFAAFQPRLQGLGELPFWLAAVCLWSSVALTVALVLWGIWRKSSFCFLASAVTAFPFAYYFFLAPGTRAAFWAPLILVGIAAAFEFLAPGNKKQPSSNLK